MRRAIESYNLWLQIYHPADDVVCKALFKEESEECSVQTTSREELTNSREETAIGREEPTTSKEVQTSGREKPTTDRKEPATSRKKTTRGEENSTLNNKKVCIYTMYECMVCVILCSY